MSKIIIFLPVFIALVGKIFSKGTPLFISNFQMSHPIIYMIISLIIIIAYIVLLSSLFNIEIESHNKYLYIILIPIVFYLISSLLNIKPPSFIINFADSHTVIFSILVGIITAFYLLLIIIAAFMVIINKDYYPSSIIIFALIPSAAIVLLYIFNIGVPTFIINFYINHKVWFYIVFSITALTYIIVLFNLLSLYRHGKSVLIFIIIFAVLTFIFRNNILFFNTNKNSAADVIIEENIKDNKENTENISEVTNIESIKGNTENISEATNIESIKENTENISEVTNIESIKGNTENISEATNIESIKENTENISEAANIKNDQKIENEKPINKKENIISKIFNGIKNWFVNTIIFLKNSIVKIFTWIKDWFVNKIIFSKNHIVKIIIGIIVLSIIIFIMRNKFMPNADILNIKINGINSSGIKLKVTLLIINNILIPIKLRRIDVKLYKDNNNIGYGNNIFFQTLNFKKCNTLELDLTVYYNEAFKSMIPYLTKTFYGKAHAYVSFRFSFIPITFRIKIIKNI